MTGIKTMIRVTDKDTQYDEKAKRLLGNKYILAYLLVKTVDEFRGMDPKEVVSYIEGEPFISTVPVEPGITNVVQTKEGEQIIGLNGEYGEINEGLIRFDIVFYVRIPSVGRIKDEVSQIIVNVEAQKDMPGSYDILNRAIFYVCRLVSSQKERDFAHSNYNDIKRVFSIWICMNTKENSMEYVHLTREKWLGNTGWKGNLNLLNIVLIGLSKKLPKADPKYELHRLLGTLFSKELSAEEKLNIMEAEYKIPLEDSIKEEVAMMCNLSQGIKEDGIEIGKEIGKEIGEAKIIISLYKNGFTEEQIAKVAEKKVDEIRTILEKNIN
ncbi:MAG: hypothetical protein IKM28_09825 [Lachnospiraceae bacterium]|nr:hypothetical protein [Lachnospiraceae bacterium]